MIPAYTMPGDAKDVHCMRAEVREGMSPDLCNDLISDIKWAYKALQRPKPKLAADCIARYREHAIC